MLPGQAGNSTAYESALHVEHLVWPALRPVITAAERKRQLKRGVACNMLSSVVSFSLAHPATHPQLQEIKTALAAPAQPAQRFFGCKSRDTTVVPDDWCDTGCSAVARNCPEDKCVCPAGSGLSFAGRPDLKPPEPRIIGGWTNCPAVPWPGYNDKGPLAEMAHDACSKEEEGPGGMPPAGDKDWGPSYKPEWGATAVLPGRFGKDWGDAKIAPIAPGKYEYNWVTVGGEGFDASMWREYAEEDIIASNGKGIAFDEEGGVNQAEAGPWITEMRKKHPDWTFLYVPSCGAKISQYDPENGGSDYIAPMMYQTNYNSYPRMDMSIEPLSTYVSECVKSVHEAGWPAARVVLTYQSFDAYRTRSESTLMELLGKMMGNHTIQLENGDTFEGPYAGVLGWPSQCGQGDERCWPDADKANMEEIMKGQKEGQKEGRGFTSDLAAALRRVPAH